MYAYHIFHAAFSFLLVSWGGVRLSPLGTSATPWPILPAPEDRLWMWSSRWSENWQGKPKCSEKTYLSATLFTNPTWPNLGSNPDRRDGKPATNRLSYGVYSYTLKIYAARPSETYLNLCHTTRRHIPEDSILYSHTHENRKYIS
jgi:hypothetical protein